ncbi:MAG: (2Fe-2S)-binding protein [Betaproteobacteria bacterium]|nr:(2Fe-2S)-binding protein [Betaproteobacteria bacterium]
MATMRLTVNGKTQTYAGDPDQPLLWYLRDTLRLTGAKYGCGAGLCGACTVHVDGKAVRACSVSMGTLAGRRVATIESLEQDGRLHAVQQAWIEEDVAQCGYCQAGQIMAVVDLLRVKPNPSDADIDALTNLCRCGTQMRVRRAVKKAAAMLRRPA